MLITEAVLTDTLASNLLNRVLKCGSVSKFSVCTLSRNVTFLFDAKIGCTAWVRRIRSIFGENRDYLEVSQNVLMLKSLKSLFLNLIITFFFLENMLFNEQKKMIDITLEQIGFAITFTNLSSVEILTIFVYGDFLHSN